METENENESKGSELANEIFSFKELITIIVDYYCFKNNVVDDDDREGDAWKIGTKHEHMEEEIIPEDMNIMIEKAFKTQLSKFIKEK